MAKTFELEDEDEEAWFKEYGLLTAKPVIYAANVAENEVADDAAGNAGVQAVKEYAAKEGSEVFVICAEIEQEIAELDDDEKALFLEELGMKESGLDKLIKASYSLLGLISYLTSGEDETRAWTIKKGTKAPQAAERSTRISSGDLSKLRWSTTRTSWIAAARQQPRRKVWCAWKEKIMWCRMAT